MAIYARVQARITLTHICQDCVKAQGMEGGHGEQMAESQHEEN